MKTIKKLLILIFSVIFTSCVSQHEDLSDIKKLSFANGSKTVDFSDLSDNLEIIPLNIPDTVVLGRIHSIRYYENYLILHDKDYAQALYIFDKEGDFVNMLRRIGAGPGEFATLESYIIHENIISVYDRRLRKGIKYQFPHLNYLETFEANGYFKGDFLNWKNYEYSIGLSDDIVEDGYYKGIVFLDDTYKSIYNIEKPSGVIEASERGSLSNIRDEIFYSEPFTEIIYQMDSTESIPLYQIDFGSNALPKEAQSLVEAEDFYEILGSGDYAFAVHNFNMTDSVISFNFYWKTIDNIRIGMYDLKNDKGLIINDIGSLRDYLTWPFAVSDGSNLSLLYPDEYDKEILIQMGLSKDEIAKLDLSAPLLLKYSLNKFPDQ